MITVDQIRAALQQVVLSDLSLDRFDEWLAKTSWNMHQDSSVEAQNLVGKIELILSDYDDGRISCEDVTDAFRKLNPVLVIKASEGVIVTTSGATTPMRVTLPSIRLVVFGKQPAAESSYTLILQG